MKWELRALRWSYCAFIAWASLETFLEARVTHEAHALWLSGLEMLAIVAFLFPAVETPACALLIVIYIIAGLLTALQGTPPFRFIYYGMTAFYLVLASRASNAAKPVGPRPAGS
jgi:hypothetical protein